MMVRQDISFQSDTSIALYCSWLENEANQYEYISYILEDDIYVDYYHLEDSTENYSYNIYFDNLTLGRCYNIKVVGKIKDDDNCFEIGGLNAYCIEKNNIENTSLTKACGDNILIYRNSNTKYVGINDADSLPVFIGERV